MNGLPICQVITVFTFRGDRTMAFRQRVFRALDDQRRGRGPGPSINDCLLFAGHSGLSADAGKIIYGFNPDGGVHPIWQVIQHLKSGGAYPGMVRNDTAVFARAKQRGLTILRFDVALPPRRFRTFHGKLNAELKRSTFSYGFPDGDGDCNCTTWMERLGLPLLTGRMDEFTAVTGVVAQVRRRFGPCT